MRRWWMVVALVPGQAAWAHDYWLEPEPAQVAVGDATTLTLHVGERLTSQAEKGWRADLAVAFDRWSASGRHPLTVADGATPAWTGSLEEPGGHLFALQRGLVWIELPADRFDGYLEHEQLASVREARAAAGASDSPGRERYTRYLKAYVASGSAAPEPSAPESSAATGSAAKGSAAKPSAPEPAVYATKVGHTLELRLLDAPVAATDLRVEVTFRGAPLANQPLTAFVRRANASSEPVQVVRRTDAEGRVTFPYATAGAWLVRTVHMVPCEGCERADWESFWASYRFDVAAAR